MLYVLYAAILAPALTLILLFFKEHHAKVLWMLPLTCIPLIAVVSQAAPARACMRLVEESARINYRWTSPLAFTGVGVFSRHTPGTLGIDFYEGDVIELQNGFGAWLRHNYKCEYGTHTRMVIQVYTRQGRLSAH